MDLLFEIGLEEVPARMLAGAQAELLKRTLALLERERLIPASAQAQSFSTPRRLAVLVHDVAERQADLTEELLGPAVKIAYKDGTPGPAAIAFAKKSGIAVEALKTVSTPKGDYIAATSTKPGRTAAEVLAAELPKELASIYWAKNMYWRAGKPERFVRPVRWLLALLGTDIVPLSFGGYQAGRQTYGHRVLFGPSPIEITDPAAYASALTHAHVMADVELRRHTIRKALDRVCRSLPNTRWREDHALVDKMTHMTEWPSVLAGSFDPDYLALPEEVLVTVMRDHQNYVAVEARDGKLAPHFLAVLNTAPDPEAEAIIRHGNERVLRARFNDARFFWEFDQRTSLEDRLPLLEKVTFQKDLGSYAAKSERVRVLADNLARLAIAQGTELDTLALDTAARLAKTDLTSELVKEFTELQGQVGGLYARAQGISPAAAQAIYDQYLPVSMEDAIPRTSEGQLLALADKADTIAGMFSLGLEPTGSKDPFALRRAANGIVKILADSKLPLTLGEIAFASYPQSNTTNGVPGVPHVNRGSSRLTWEQSPGLSKAADLEPGASEPQTQGAPFIAPSEMSGMQAPKPTHIKNHEEVVRSLELFFAERVEFYLREAKGQAYDVVAAVLAAGANDVRDAVARAEALTAVRGSADFSAVCAAFKRMKNILAQAATHDAAAHDPAAHISSTGVAPAQQDLADAAQSVAIEVELLRTTGDYESALRAIATLRPQVDAFFDQLMVMDPDPDIRASRLTLLAHIVQQFSRLADFSEIVVPG